MIILEKCQPEKWPITLLVQAILHKFYIFSFYEIPLISNSSLSIFFKVVLFFKEILYFYFLILISTLVWKTLICMIWHQFPSWRNIASHRVFHTNFQLRKKLLLINCKLYCLFCRFDKIFYTFPSAEGKNCSQNVPIFSCWNIFCLISGMVHECSAITIVYKIVS